MSAVHIKRRRTRCTQVAFPQIRDDVWSGTGSNCRPSAFQADAHSTDPEKPTAAGHHSYIVRSDVASRTLSLAFGSGLRRSVRCSLTEPPKQV
jgi:hypothetical protein